MLIVWFITQVTVSTTTRWNFLPNKQPLLGSIVRLLWTPILVAARWRWGPGTIEPSPLYVWSTFADTTAQETSATEIRSKPNYPQSNTLLRSYSYFPSSILRHIMPSHSAYSSPSASLSYLLFTLSTVRYHLRSRKGHCLQTQDWRKIVGRSSAKHLHSPVMTYVNENMAP